MTPERFDDYAREGREMGFAFIASGPLVRSSYHAAEGFVEARLRPPGAPEQGHLANDAQLGAAAFPLQERQLEVGAALISPESLVRR